MNIKKVLLATLSTGLIATTLLHTNYANAAEEDIPGESGGLEHELPQSTQSDVKIKFTAPTEPVGPLDPDNPDNPLEDGEGVVTSYKGPLSLNYVSNILFEGGDLDVEGKTYKAVTKTPNIQVSDNRGFGYGWHVTAKASSFKNGEDDSLPGATIFLKNGTAVTPGTSKNPEVDESIELITGDEPSKMVVNSNARSDGEPQGLGQWIIKWVSDADTERNNNVTLKIPAGSATEGTHTAKINWTLYDGPFAGNQ